MYCKVQLYIATAVASGYDGVVIGAEKKMQLDAQNGRVGVEASLALLDEQTGPGALVLFSHQRKHVNAVIEGEIGANAEEHALARAKVYSVALSWLDSDDPVVQQRAVRAVSRLERHRIKTLDSVTNAIDVERRGMIEAVKLLKARRGRDGNLKEVGFQTVAEIVAALEAEQKSAQASDTGGT